MIEHMKQRILKLLENNDTVRTAFDREFSMLMIWLKKDMSRKCTYAFIAGALSVAVMFGGSFYYFKTSDDTNILKQLIERG